MPRTKKQKLPDDGFTEAQSDNLPRVDEFMVACFFSSSTFLSNEGKNVKTVRSGRASYGENSVGFVQVCREGKLCTVKAEVTPEHKVSASPYVVTCIIDEESETITVGRCESCPAKEAGCKHAIAFIKWLERKTDEPSRTSVACYWREPALAKVGSSFMRAEEIKAQKIAVVKEEDAQAFFDEVTNYFKQNDPDILVIKHLSIKESLSIHNLMIMFKDKIDIKDHSPENFETFSAARMTDHLCKNISKETVGQSKSPLWKALRYARISGCKVYEASRCHTSDGALVKRILGITKVHPTHAMKRGLNLEGDVLNVIQKKHRTTITNIGFVMRKDEPLFGASPDGILGDMIIEIKCPMSEKSFLTYFQNNFTEPSNKYKGQIHLEMFMTGKKKALFCVAHPDFETTKLVDEIEVTFDEEFCEDMMKKSKKFWMEHIYSHLYKNV